MHTMQNAILFYPFYPSACPSLCGIISKQYTYRITFWLSGRYYDSFFEPYRCCKIPRNPLSVGTLNIRGNLRFWIFDRNRSFYCHWKWYEMGLWLLWITNRKSFVADRSVTVPMTLSDLVRRDMRSLFCLADLRTYGVRSSGRQTNWATS